MCQDVLNGPALPHELSSSEPRRTGSSTGGAALQSCRKVSGLVLTPFERNLEVWRQLWRVIERSHLVVQIVDARNPLRFRCEDLEKYVSSLGIGSTNGIEYLDEDSSEKGPRRNLLLINKADLLDDQQRRYWADYFDAQGIQYAFFSAANAAAIQLARAREEERLRLEQLKLAEPRDEDDEEDESEDEDEEDEEDEETNKISFKLLPLRGQRRCQGC